MLKEPIPTDPKKWEDIKIGAELPHPKVIMETGKLNEATTQKDADNILIDQIRRQAETGAYLQNYYHSGKEPSFEAV